MERLEGEQSPESPRATESGLDLEGISGPCPASSRGSDRVGLAPRSLPGMAQRMSRGVWAAAGRSTSIPVEDESGLEGGGGSGDRGSGKIFF